MSRPAPASLWGFAVFEGTVVVGWKVYPDEGQAQRKHRRLSTRVAAEGRRLGPVRPLSEREAAGLRRLASD